MTHGVDNSSEGSFKRSLWLVLLANIFAAGCFSAVPPQQRVQPLSVVPQEREPSPGPPSFQLRDTVVRRVFQDSRGDLWFGTNGRGVIRYQNGELTYFNSEHGLGGHAVRGIVEDDSGHLWFATSGGVSRFDGRTFTNFSEFDGLHDSDTWSITITHDGTIWVGTLAGAHHFDGHRFHHFALPKAEEDPSRGVTSAEFVHHIMEDTAGRLWFATNGGAYVLSDNGLSNINTAHGLCGDVVNSILEDVHGRMWFATHHNGVCQWDGETFTHYGERDGITGHEVWSLYLDAAGDVWFPVENAGVYRFNGDTFTNYHDPERMPCPAIQTIYEDRSGAVWMGGWMTLYRRDGTQVRRYVEETPG